MIASINITSFDGNSRRRTWLNAWALAVSGAACVFLLSVSSVQPARAASVAQQDGVEVAPAREPVIATISIERPQRIMSGRARRDVSREIADGILSAADEHPGRLITVRLDGTPLRYGDLSRAEQKAVRDINSAQNAHRRKSRAAYQMYELGLAFALRDGMRLARSQSDDLHLSVLGLPMEPQRDMPQAVVEEVNQRYQSALDEMDAIVATKAFILRKSASDMKKTLHQGMPQALSESDGRPIIFKGNGKWNLATEATDEGPAKSSGGAPQSDRKADDDGDGEGSSSLLSSEKADDHHNPLSRRAFNDVNDDDDGDVATSETLSPDAAGQSEYGEDGDGDGEGDGDGDGETPWFHWNFRGDSAPEVEHMIEGLPIARDTKIFYAYELGEVPRVHNGEMFYGGVPQAQEANLDAHLARVVQDVNTKIPDPEWEGLAVIDYEQWTVYWEDVKELYKEMSRQIVIEEHGSLSDEEIEQMAEEEFEAAAREFVTKTINLCKELRPNVTWGYFLHVKYTGPQLEELGIEEEIAWFWELNDAFFPSIYASRFGMDDPPTDDWHGSYNAYRNRVKKRIDRCLARGDQPVYPYARWRYHGVNDMYGDQPLNSGDLEVILGHPHEIGATGVILWDAFHDPEFIEIFEAYLDSTMADMIIELDEQFSDTQDP